jgi:glycosyltransferase involved in cell wall biosynthesis
MIIFTIVIPCFNEAEHIGKCLSSLNNQNFPRNQFEIIVVDNGSEDASVEISQALADRTIVYPDGKVGAVRNKGASEAKGQNLVFIDADCTMDNDWLNRALKLLSRNANTAFGGGCLLPPDASWIEKCWLLEGRDGNTLPKELIGCSIVTPRKVFKDIGGFDECMASGEDSELSARLKSAGYVVNMTRGLNVTHWGNAKTQFDFFNRQAWHAEQYKKSWRSNIKDPIFLLALVFCTSTVATLVSLPLGSTKTFLGILLLAVAPFALTVKRYFRTNRRPHDIKEALCSYYLDALYLTGRAWGLLRIALERVK